jgi:hypothetical protein
MIQANSWAPAPFMAPSIGQPMPSPIVTPPPKPAFIDSALMAFMVDAAAATATGMIAYTYGKAGSKWAAFWWSVMAVTGFKGLADLSRIRER